MSHKRKDFMNLYSGILVKQFLYFLYPMTYCQSAPNHVLSNSLTRHKRFLLQTISLTGRSIGWN